MGSMVASLSSMGTSIALGLIGVPLLEASLYKIPCQWYKGFCRPPVDGVGRRVSGKESISIYGICPYSHEDKALPLPRWKEFNKIGGFAGSQGAGSHSRAQSRPLLLARWTLGSGEGRKSQQGRSLLLWPFLSLWPLYAGAHRASGRVRRGRSGLWTRRWPSCLPYKWRNVSERCILLFRFSDIPPLWVISGGHFLGSQVSPQPSLIPRMSSTCPFHSSPRHINLPLSLSKFLISSTNLLATAHETVWISSSVHLSFQASEIFLSKFLPTGKFLFITVFQGHP